MNMTVISPQEAFTKIRRRIKPEWKFAFFSAVVLGLIVHFYLFVHFFPNWDGIRNFYSSQDMTTSGRWFLTYACRISSYFYLPWVNGVLSVFYLSLACVVITELLEIRSRIFILMTSAVLVTFPSIACTFSYQFTSDGYMLALLLTCLAVLVTARWRYGFLLGAVMLSMSLGTYQAYFPIAILLCMAGLFLMLIRHEKSKPFWKQVLRYLAMGVLGFLLYLGILYAILKITNQTLTQYQGMNGWQSMTPSVLWGNIHAAYSDFYHFAVSNRIFHYSRFLLYAHRLSLLLLVVGALYFYIHEKMYKRHLISLLLLAAVILLPAVISMELLLSTDMIFHMLMRLPWCMVYIGLLMLAEKAGLAGKVSKLVTVRHLYQWLSVLCCAVIAFNFYLLSNIAYLNMQERSDKTYAFCLRVADRMQQIEGYREDMPVDFVMVFNSKNYPNISAANAVINGMTGTVDSISIEHQYHFKAYMENILNIRVVLATEEQRQEVSRSAEFRQMKDWPDESAVKIVDGILVVRMNGPSE